MATIKHISRLILLSAALIAIPLGCGAPSIAPAIIESDEEYQTRIKSWRSEYEKTLTADDGWLTLAGLEWLEQGENTVGVGKEFDIPMPNRIDTGKFGTFMLKDKVVMLRVEGGKKAFVEDKPVTEIELQPDTTGKPTVVKSGDIEMLLLKRNEKFGIRIRDKKSESRTNFNGLKWFSIDRSYAVVANFESFGEDRDFEVLNVIDQTVKMTSPGILRFKLKGKNYSLQPAHNGDGRLFIIFRDPTSKTETYQAGRYMYTEMPKDGRLILDFNKAENPPCAYTEFATCPLPPPQNELDIAIRAGEKRFADR